MACRTTDPATFPRKQLAFALCAPLLLLVASCYEQELRPCYGMERHTSIGVHLFEVASPSGTYPLFDVYSYGAGRTTCAELDGLGVGDTVVFSDVALVNEVGAEEVCSTPVGDAVLDGDVVAHTLRDESAAEYLFEGGAFRGGVGAAAPGATIGECTGTWTLATYPLGVVYAHVDASIFSSEWLDEYTFDPLSPGNEPPVVIVRTFVVDEGTACPALGVAAGPFTCGDVFSGFYERAP